MNKCKTMKRKILILFGMILVLIAVMISMPIVVAFTEPPEIPENEIGKPTGGTIKTLCSSGCTFSSLSQADGSVGAGNTLKIKAGTYSATTWDESGSSGNEIVIEAYGDGFVYIKGSGFRINGNNIIFDGKSFSSPQIIFKDISGDLAAIRAKGNSITFYRCEFTQNSPTNMYAIGNYVKVYNCKIHDFLYYGIYFKNGYHSEFRNNIFWNLGGVAIQTNPHDSGEVVTDGVISGNAIYNCGKNYKGTGKNKGTLTVLSGTGDKGNLSGLTISNNLIWDCSSNGCISFGGGVNFAGIIEDVKVYGNTVMGYINNGNGQSGTTKFKNNIVTGSVSGSDGFIEYKNNEVGSTSMFESTNSGSSNFLKLK